MNALMNPAPQLVVAAVPKQGSFIQRLTNFMRRQPWLMVIIWPALLAVGMGWLDHATTWELSLFVFYAVPVVIAAWWAGSPAGMFMAVFCGVVWWFANEATHPYETTLGYAWATVSRMIFFAVMPHAFTIWRSAASWRRTSSPSASMSSSASVRIYMTVCASTSPPSASPRALSPRISETSPSPARRMQR
jgi:hypothetical protein